MPRFLIPVAALALTVVVAGSASGVEAGESSHGAAAVVGADRGNSEPPARGPRSTSVSGILQSATDVDILLEDATGHWAPTRCVGNGSSGPRIQPVYVYRTGRADRYPKFAEFFARSLKLTTGIVERSSEGRRTPRWRHDSQCQPVIWRIAVPDAYTHTLVSLRDYLRTTDSRFRRGNRVYSMWVDSTTSPNWSGLGDDRWSATWSGSWGFVWVDAHELGHALGAVSGSAPHSTGRAHCWDEHDLMCYDDGSPLFRRIEVCPMWYEYRLDCRQDDYFAVRPRPGSWLARNPKANMARSRFLSKSTPTVLPVRPPRPVNVRIVASGTQRYVNWTAQAGVGYDIAVEKPGGDVDFLAFNQTSGPYPLPWRAAGKLFVRAVNDAGVSDRVSLPLTSIG